MPRQADARALQRCVRRRACCCLVGLLVFLLLCLRRHWPPRTAPEGTTSMAAASAPPPTAPWTAELEAASQIIWDYHRMGMPLARQVWPESSVLPVATISCSSERACVCCGAAAPPR